MEVDLIGRSGKCVKKDVYDIDYDFHVKQNMVNGKFEAYISRWYRLPLYFDDPISAFGAIKQFQKKYDIIW